MDSVLIQSPNAEPIDLAMAKLQIGLTGTDLDLLVTKAIAAARDDAEARTNRQIIHARYKRTLDAFPTRYCSGAPLDYLAWNQAWQAYRPMDVRHHLPPTAIVLPQAPVVRVVSVGYTDTSGAPQTVSSTDYVANLAAVPAFVAPAFGKSWPIALLQQGSVSVTYDVGYASKFVANASADTLTVSSSPMDWAVNDVVRVSNSGGVLPTPLQPNTDYYVKTAASGVYTLSATQGGSTIDLTTAGTGTSYIGEIPAALTNWMLARAESQIQIRGDVALTDRGQDIRPNPYIDSLLDQFVVYVYA